MKTNNAGALQIEQQTGPLVEDGRPLVTRILQSIPEQPPTLYAGWARYKNECADFVDRLRAALSNNDASQP